MCLDTWFCVKWLTRLSIFIHADILVLVCSGGNFIYAVVGANHCGHIPENAKTECIGTKTQLILA